MDSAGDRPAGRPRAAAALRALNHDRSRGVVLACRTGDFGAIATGPAGDVSYLRRVVVAGAMHVAIQPLEPDAVRRYVRALFPGPGESDQAAAHLLNALIPAIAKGDEDFHVHGWEPEQIRTWLVTLARHQTRMAAMGASETDIELLDLWQVAGPYGLLRRAGPSHSTSPLQRLALDRLGTVFGQRSVLKTLTTDWTFGLGAALVMVVVIMLEFGLEHGFAVGLVVGLAAAPAVGLMVWLVLGLVEGLTADGAATSAKALIRQAVSYDIAVGLAVGLAIGLAIGLAVALGFGREVRFTIGFTVMETVMFTMSARRVRTGRRAGGLTGNLFILLLVAAALVLIAVPVGTFIDKPASRMALGSAAIPTAILAVVLVGVPLLILAGGPSWPSYWWGTSRAARLGLLPDHFVGFLDWCLSCGLMRVSGTSIQFRHRIFQTWLATVRVER